MSSRQIPPPPSWTCPRCNDSMHPVMSAKGEDHKMWHCERCGNRVTHEHLANKEKKRVDTQTNNPD